MHLNAAQFIAKFLIQRLLKESMMVRRNLLSFLLACILFSGATQLFAAEQPIAIFHAFNQQFKDVEEFVCDLADQGYSHVQISPVQKSNPGPFQAPTGWSQRYQPVDYGIIIGLGSESQLQSLINKAHGCKVKVIADVVFNHMADLDGGDGFENLTKYPGLIPGDFNTVISNPGQRPCKDTDPDGKGYSDGNRNSELTCWLGSLPDLKFTSNVKAIQKAHLKKLLDMGIDGFRFDAAKHMPESEVREYIGFIDTQSQGKTWNYLEVIEDGDTSAYNYNSIAAVTDFVLYNSIKNLFSFCGDLRSLPSEAVNDSRSVTFGRNHDSVAEIRLTKNDAYNPYDDPTNSFFATAYVLARQDGTPLVFNDDNFKSTFIKFGVKFRQIMSQRGKEGKNVKEAILRVTNSDTILVMERGTEGFFVENKGANKFDMPELDLTLTNLEGCYRELRSRNFTISIERNGQGKKFVTRWGTFSRGGMEVQARDALFFIRDSFSACSR
jgi:alpha-amylase